MIDKGELSNDFTGKEMKKFIDGRLKEIERFLAQSKKGIDIKN